MMRAGMLAAALLLGAAAPDPVVAERGADHITLSQARALIAATDADTRARLTATPAALTEWLRNLLLQRALVQQAKAEHWDQRPDVAALLQRAHDQVSAQSYLAAHATVPAGYPSAAELQAAYDQNRSKLMQPRGYHLVQLFVPGTSLPAPAAKARLATIRQQVTGEAGRGHLTLETAAGQIAGAQTVDLGWLPETQIVPAIKAAVAGLPEGGLTDPVCTENGCHLIRLVATRPAGPAPLADIRDGLVRALRSQKQAELERAYASTLLAAQPVAVNEIEVSRLGH